MNPATWERMWVQLVVAASSGLPAHRQVVFLHPSRAGALQRKLIEKFCFVAPVGYNGDPSVEGLPSAGGKRERKRIFTRTEAVDHPSVSR